MRNAATNSLNNSRRNLRIIDMFESEGWSFATRRCLQGLRSGSSLILPWWSLLHCSPRPLGQNPDWSPRWAGSWRKQHSWAEETLLWRWTDPPLPPCPHILGQEGHRETNGGLSCIMFTCSGVWNVPFRREVSHSLCFLQSLVVREPSEGILEH